MSICVFLICTVRFSKSYQTKTRRNGFSILIDPQIYTDQDLIERVWYACVCHGYISKDYDIMGKLRRKLCYKMPKSPGFLDQFEQELVI